MVEIFQGHRSSRYDKIMQAVWMILILISMYVAMYWHFYLRYLKSPYSKYTALLSLFTLPFAYLTVWQLKKGKRQIRFNETEIQVISDSTTESLPYDKISHIKSKHTDSGCKSIVLRLESCCELGVVVNSDSSDELLKLINQQAPNATSVTEHISSKQEMKIVLGVIGFTLAVCSGWFVVVYLATK